MNRAFLLGGLLSAALLGCSDDTSDGPGGNGGGGRGGDVGNGGTPSNGGGNQGGGGADQGGAADGGAAPGGASAGGAGGQGQGGANPAEDPVPQINHPGDMECRVVNQSVPFVGVATDPQEGALTGASLVWVSSVDGQIGTGAQFDHTPTSVGNHVITLTATDADGNTGTDQITLIVQAQCP